LLRSGWWASASSRARSAFGYWRKCSADGRFRCRHVDRAAGDPAVLPGAGAGGGRTGHRARPPALAAVGTPGDPGKADRRRCAPRTPGPLIAPAPIQRDQHLRLRPFRVVPRHQRARSRDQPPGRGRAAALTVPARDRPPWPPGTSPQSGGFRVSGAPPGNHRAHHDRPWQRRARACVSARGAVMDTGGTAAVIRARVVQGSAGDRVLAADREGS